MKASPDPGETFYPSLQSPWLWRWVGVFALSTIRMSLRCWKHCSHLSPCLLPPEGGGLLGVCHPPHIRPPFPEWHLLVLPLSVQCLAVSHLSWGDCGLCPDLRSSRICSGWHQDAGSWERPHHLLHSGGFLHMVMLPISTPTRAKKSLGQPFQRQAAET